MPRSMLTACVLGLLLLLATSVRLQEPSSSPQIAAEDPYTHMVFTKEHFERGYFDDSIHAGWKMYPAGMHAFVGVFHETTGIGLHELALYLPVAFGVFSVMGIFVVALRLAGLPAATVAAAALALMPEHVFRTNVLFPTAVDLALLPLYLWSAVELTEGRYSWAWFLVLTGLVLALTHPFIVPLAALMISAYGLLLLARDPHASLWPRAVPVALAVMLAGMLAVLAIRIPQGEFSYWIFYHLIRTGAGTIVPALIAVAVGAVLLLALLRAAVRVPDRFRAPAGVACIGVGVGFAWPPLTADLPRFVDYPHQIGWVAMGLALIGLLSLPLRSSRLGLLGLAVVLATFPFTATNVFDSPWWPHRTVAFLTLGVALLVGAGAAALAEGAQRLAHARWPPGAPAAAAIATLLVSAGVVAGAPSQFSWYRLYDDESYEALEWAVDEMARDPQAAFMNAHWKSNAVLKALGDMERVLYHERFFADDAERHRLVEHYQGEGLALHVVVDEDLREQAKKKGWDLSFLEREGYTLRVSAGDVQIFSAPPAGR